jgi:predicted nucleic acid-binding protein
LIAIDACVVISFLADEKTAQAVRLEALLGTGEAVLAPSVVTELLSDPSAGGESAALIEGLIQLPLLDGYWSRAGMLRAAIRRAGRKAALGDALLAQACLDADCALLTADTDFKAFAELAGLRLER